MATDTDTSYTEKNFVYQGKRRSAKGEMWIQLSTLDANGNMDEKPKWFDAKSPKRNLIVGGVYRGASFNDAGSMRGITDVQYVGTTWQSQADVMEWQALEEQAMARAASDKLQKDAKRVTEIERTLLPLRELYAHAGKFGAYDKQAAIEAAMLRALRKAPRAGEGA